MTAFQKQLEAIATALLLIERLPDNAVWALEVTNDDDAESPTVLNIFTPTSDGWDDLAKSLKLGRCTDESVDDNEFRSYRQGTLYISIIQEDYRDGQ